MFTILSIAMELRKMSSKKDASEHHLDGRLKFPRPAWADALASLSDQGPALNLPIFMGLHQLDPEFSVPKSPVVVSLNELTASSPVAEAFAPTRLDELSLSVSRLEAINADLTNKIDKLDQLILSPKEKLETVMVSEWRHIVWFIEALIIGLFADFIINWLFR